MAHYNEDLYVEKPFVEQLKSLGWDVVSANREAPESSLRSSFKDTFIQSILRTNILRLNPFLENDQLEDVMSALSKIGGSTLLEANEEATKILLEGVNVEENRKTGEKTPTVRFVDFENPLANDFTAVTQFKVQIPWTDKHIVPDIVLFVNGIPISVVECKSPTVSEPLEEAVVQLHRYQDVRGSEVREGNEKLFHFNQFVIATTRQEARVATIWAKSEHFLEWKDSYPTPLSALHIEEGSETVNSQQVLVEGLLRKENLIDVIGNFVIFNTTPEGKKIKVICRYQQYRAVSKAVKKLWDPGLTQADKGGVIWHTQGSGKSLTMIFLIRKLRKTDFWKKLKIVFLTDRSDLQRQIGETAKTIGETIYPKERNSIETVQAELRTDNSNIVNAMIHKFQERNSRTEDDEDEENGGTNYVRKVEEFPLLNHSKDILLLIDEAHRTQAWGLGVNLSKALPNAIKIGFTGTPIITENRGKKTHEIFWEYIDTYTIEQAVADGATVSIIYLWRTSRDTVKDKAAMDAEFEDVFKDKSDEEKSAILKKYGNKSNYLNAPEIIEKKAADMVRFYVQKVFVNWFKAQVVTNSRRAAIIYKEKIDAAIKDEAEMLKNGTSTLENPELIDVNLLSELETAVIISGKNNDDEAYRKYTNADNHKKQIEGFKKPLIGKDESKRSPIGIIIVKDMLLTGFDAPIDQVLFLDRRMVEHNLLQTIARVNRTASWKNCGYIVDYYGIGNHLKEALEIFSNSDIEWALKDLSEEIPKLEERHRAVVQVFKEHGIKRFDTNEDVDLCIDLLEDVRIRAKFTVAFKMLSQSIDIVSPDKAVFPFLNGFKTFGFILYSARNRYRDNELNILWAGEKVRKIIDAYVMSQGIDPSVPPISILDKNFDEFLNGQMSGKAKASEMEHAIRYHITRNFEDDPEFYKDLSERLEELIKEQKENWEKLATDLGGLLERIRAGRGDELAEWIVDERQMPFYDIIKNELFEGVTPTREEQSKIIDLTIEVFAIFQNEISGVDFWRDDIAHKRVKRQISEHVVSSRLVPVSDLKKKDDLIERLFTLAKHLDKKLLS